MGYLFLTNQRLVGILSLYLRTLSKQNLFDSNFHGAAFYDGMQFGVEMQNACDAAGVRCLDRCPIKEIEDERTCDVFDNNFQSIMRRYQERNRLK